MKRNMKKMLSVLAVVIMALALVCFASAEEIPQSEGGKKFDSDFAMNNGLVNIYYEEEGYRVAVDLFNQETNAGTLWEYSCRYNEEKDCLLSTSSRKVNYTMDVNTLEKTFAENEYEGLDADDAVTVFSLSDSGKLVWKDGHENMGQDLEFTNIGRFNGLWRNEEQDYYTEIWWQGLLDENQFFYSIFIGHGEDDYHMAGLYNPETGRLECYDTVVSLVQTNEDVLAAQAAGRPFDAVFTHAENGRLVVEGAVNAELTYDILGPES